MAINAPSNKGILAVGNFDSNEGYAWRLMERFWCDLSAYGREEGYKTYVCFPTISIIPQCLKNAGCQVDAVDFTSTNIRSVTRQIRYLINNSIRVLYLTDLATYSWRYLLFRLVGVKIIIVHDHTPGVRSVPSEAKAIVKRSLNRAPFISCTAGLAVSPYVAERLVTVNGLPKEKVFCVTNGIDLVDSGSRTPDKEEAKDLVRIVTVGRVCYYKGLDFALDVMSLLANEYSSIRFEYVIIGDGPDRAEFTEKARQLGLGDIVRFVGNVDNVAERLRECDIAFHPSRGEAMSLAILEYMRAGLPVVASNNPSVSSALKDNEYAKIYQAEHTESAAVAINELLESPQMREQLGSSARQQVVENFSSEVMLSKFRSAISTIMG